MLQRMNKFKSGVAKKASNSFMDRRSSEKIVYQKYKWRHAKYGQQG